MMFDLNGKTALVTGASGAIGGAIARALHAQGATVAISGTRKEALDGLASALGNRVFVLPCDLADKDAVEALVPSAEEKMEKLDILVANAGVNRDNLFVQLRDEDWDNVIAVNLTATFRLARAAVSRMMRRRWGRVIGISSVVGFTGNPGQEQLHGFQSRHGRNDQVGGGRICQAKHHGQLHSARPHRLGHDRQAQ